MMRIVAVALLLVLPLAVPARSDTGPVDRTSRKERVAQRKENEKFFLATIVRIGELRAAVEAQSATLATTKDEQEYQRTVAKIRNLALALEAMRRQNEAFKELTEQARRAVDEAPPAPRRLSWEDKLDLILLKLNDLARWVRKREREKGILYDGY